MNLKCRPSAERLTRRTRALPRPAIVASRAVPAVSVVGASAAQASCPPKGRPSARRWTVPVEQRHRHVARQAVVTATVADLGLAQEDDEAGLEIGRRVRPWSACSVDGTAVAAGVGRVALDFAGAVGDGDDELRRHRGVARQLAGGCVLLHCGRSDRPEQRLDPLDHLPDPLDRGDRLRRILLQLADLAGDLLGRLMGLDRECLDLVSDHRKAAPGAAGPGGLGSWR